MLPQQAIVEYKLIYKKLYGVELSEEEATLRANNLLNLYKAVYEEPVFDDQAQTNQE